MKIVILDGYTANPGDLSWSRLERLGQLTVYDRTPNNPKDIIERIGDAEIVLTNKTLITKEVFDACPSLQYVGVLATGYNVVDIQAAKEEKVIVTNIPGYSTDSVVQMVFAHLLNICFHVAEHSQAVYKGQWQNSEDFTFWNYPLVELAGKTLGIVGMGEIGRKVAVVAKAFGMHVVATSRTYRPENEVFAELVTMEELFSKADVVSLHCPLTEETQELINKNTIAAMKDGVILINTARGPIVNEKDLRDALESGKISYAGVDVVSAEPIQPDNPLLAAKNCYITPHIGWAPRESRIRQIDIACANVEAWINGAAANVVE